MTITIREVKTRSDLKKFIYLPSVIHKNHPQWVPPIYMDEWSYFDKKKNHLFDHCDSILLLAYRDGRCAGRCMGLISHPYNEAHQEKTVRFSFLECWNDQEVFDAMISHIAQWGKAKGMTQIVGPLAFSDKDPQGFLIEGYREPVVIASNCNFPFMKLLCETAGFEKKVDLVVYKINIPDQIPELHLKIAERARLRNPDLRLLEFTSRKKLKPFIYPVLELVNRTFGSVYGFVPFTKQEMDDFANRYLYLIDSRYVKIVINTENRVVGMVIGMADISEGIKRSKGKLFPFGFLKILLAARRSQQLNLLLGAIDPDYQGRGLDAWMGNALITSAKQTGKRTIDSHLELETNTKVRAEMERMGGKVYKRFRIFVRSV